MNNQLTTRTRQLTSRRGWAYGLFWSWNLIFLAFMFLGFAPRLLPEMIIAVRAGSVPAAFLAYAVILTAIPAVALILGLTILRRSPGRLFALGYAVEGPLMLMLGIRFFLVRDMTPAVALLLSMAGLSMAAFLWQILDRDIDARGPLPAHLRVIGLTLFLVIALYASLWLAFYAVPFAAWALDSVAETLRHFSLFWLGNSLKDLVLNQWRWIPFWILGTILFVYTATLFVVMPVAVPVLAIRAWWRGVRTLVAGYGRRRAIALATATLAVCAVLFVLTNRQPQQLAFKLLETPPSTPAEAQALINRQEAIRAGLLNAYLAPLRYFSAVGEVRHVSQMYKSALGMSPPQAEGVRQLYETVAYPVLYVPVHPPEAGTIVDNRALVNEPREAAVLYERFFDQTIIEGERDTIVQAVRSTWSIDQAQAALQTVDDREVHLNRQAVTVTENGDWAEVELYEVYQNQTAQRQEVVYYFSLPESAVITGLWLGNSADRQARFAYRVSPRGAAQAVYRNEVQRYQDPALVEQIGPRQYRLRIFPVEPLRWRRDAATDRSIVEAAPPLHMWLTWRVLASDNAWPLPRLAEKRNVYWDAASVRLVNGAPMAAGVEAWLPASVLATSPVKPVAHRVDFPGGETVVVRPVSAGDLPKLAADLRLAVVLDRSRSMAEHAADVKAALARLAEVANPGTVVDVYLTASKYRGEEPSVVGLAELDPDGIVYYAGQNAAELLAQFDMLRTGRYYDAIFVLTDGTGYELGQSGIEVPIPATPVWMVHLGGNFPLGYDDATLAAIQASGGGVTGYVEEALTRLAVALEAGRSVSSPDAPPAETTDVVDGYAWLTVPTEVAETMPGEAVVVNTASDGFAAFAARRLILAAMHRQRGALGQLDTLDHLHAIAVKYGVVTPYSSMIVLVNQWQQKLLDQLEARGDRFQREVEEVGETTPQSPFTVTGVPEPEEWLLLTLATAMLIWYVYTTRLKARRERILRR
jgi:putative PEP-CTERM system integral membrane protein